MRLSGLLATIEMEEGKELTPSQLKPTLASKGVDLVSVEKAVLPDPVSVYLAEATGLG